MIRRIFNKSMTAFFLAVLLTCLPFLLMCSNIEALKTESGITANDEKTLNNESAEKETVSISEKNINIASLKGPTSIGMIKMHEERPILEENTVSNYEIVASPEIMISKLLSGEVDIATLPTNVAAKLYNKGVDYKLAAIVGENVLYIVNQKEEIKSWQDLKNKKINVISKGSSPDVVFRYLLEENNIDAETDVVLDYSVEQIELSQLMISGKAEIGVLPEPFVTMVLAKNENVKLSLDFGKEYSRLKNNQALPMSCLMISSELAQNNPELITSFLEKYKESIDWVNNNIDDASRLVEKFEIGMDALTAREAIPRCNIKYTDSSQAKNLVNDYIKTLLDFSPEDVGGKIPDEKFYY